MGNTGASTTAASPIDDQQPDPQQQNSPRTVNSNVDTIQNINPTTDNASNAPVSVQNNSTESRTATTAFSSSSAKTVSKQPEKPNTFTNSNESRTTPANEFNGISGRSTTYSVPNTQPDPTKNKDKFSIQRSNSKESETSLFKSEGKKKLDE